MLDRRSLLKATGALALAGSPMLPRFARAADQVPLVPGLPDGEYTTATLEALPGKKPLIKLSYRPPNYETPVSYFNSEFTANDAFFVRYHLAGIPDSIDAKTWKLKIGGEAAATPFEIGMDELQKNFEPVEIPAVLQCSGNRRGLSTPHVPGVEWGVGAMGNAVWKGARLKDILAKAGLKPEAVESSSMAPMGRSSTRRPNSSKASRCGKPLDENTLIAYAMNVQPTAAFQRLSGPARDPRLDRDLLDEAHRVAQRGDQAVRRVLDEIGLSHTGRQVRDRAKFHVPGRLSPTTPITEMVVNTLITTPDGSSASVKSGEGFIKGIAWDAGYALGHHGHDGAPRTRSGRPAWRHG